MIADAAVQELTRLGLSKHESRVRGLIKQLSNESLTGRFRRAIIRLRSEFGADIVPNSLEADCAQAVQFRGRAAHTNQGWQNVDLRDFGTSIRAVELVAFLLMWEGFSLSTEAKRRLRSHRVIVEYDSNRTN
jgi:hypothetical protein